MPSLIATRDFSYATRRLKAGDSFEVSDRDARILVAIKRARAPREPGVIAPPSRALAGKLAQLDHDHDGKAGGSRSADGDLTALRQTYFTKVGKRPFNGWDAAELRRRMAAAEK